MSLVLDASVMLAWIYEEQTDFDLDLLYEFVERRGAFVPQIWPLEIVNILLLNQRKAGTAFRSSKTGSPS